MLAVQWGDNETLLIAPDLLRGSGDFIDEEIPISAHAGETNTLTFRLISRGEPSNVVEISQIAITESDDADSDGVSNADELALGMNSLSDDTDGDGLADGYELNVSHTDPLNYDTDFDGQDDAAEIIAGTDPLDTNSSLRISDVGLAPSGQFMLKWMAKAGKTYRVVRASALDLGDYRTIASGIPGIEPKAVFTDVTLDFLTTPKAFYRVELEQ